MDFGTAIATCFRKYATFKGRAPRSEYWWFALFGLLVQVCANILDDAVMKNDSEATAPFTTIQAVVLLLPTFAVTARRFHDIDFSGWVGVGSFFLLVIMLVLAHGMPDIAPLFNSLAGIIGLLMLIALCGRGTDGPNKYGENPLPSPKMELSERPPTMS